MTSPTSGQSVHCYAAGRVYPPTSDEFHRDRKGQVNMMNGEFCPGWYGRRLPPPPITEFDRAMIPWTTGLLIVSAAAIAARVLVGMIGATRGNTSPAADPQSTTRMVARCAAVGVLVFGLAAAGAGCFIHAYASTPVELFPVIVKLGLAILSFCAATLAACGFWEMVRTAREETFPAAGPRNTSRMVARCAAVGVLVFGLAAIAVWCFIDGYTSTPAEFFASPVKGVL